MSSTANELLLALQDDDRPGFLHENGAWTFRRIIVEGQRRAALFNSVHDSTRPPHIGVLLDNTPDYLFWLVGAALSGSVVVGINSTYRGTQLAQLIEHSDCEVLVTSTQFANLIDLPSLAVPADRVFVVDHPEYAEQLANAPQFTGPRQPITPEDLLLLVFTSGSTGLPKAVRCTQGRLARTGAHVASIAQLGDTDVVYSPLPFFHSSSLFTGWAATLSAKIPIATRTRFSASRTMPDVREYGATMLTYTGKVLNYILSVPESPEDHDIPLRLAVGNEASLADITAFSQRFDCVVRDSYGSTEGVIIIKRDPAMPPGSLGEASPTVKILDPETQVECPPIHVDAEGRLTNLLEATGEIVETQPTGGFEGYYNNEAAARERFRDGQYWSGDLGYRDAEGWIYFAGRSNEWLRVDGENFSAAPVEAIIARHPQVRSVAVYAVPDDPVGDRVMAGLELHGDATLDPVEFDNFLARQPDLGTKWTPSFIRIEPELPKLASMKIDKSLLRREAWRTGTELLWRPAKGQPLQPLTATDQKSLERLLP